MRRVPLALALAVPVGATALALAPAAGAATWGAPVRVSPPDRASYSSGAVAAGPAGAAVAAWLRTPAGAPRGAGRVQLASRPPRRGWARARTLSGPGASLPRTALNARGDAAAAWLNGRLIVAAVRRGPRGVWAAGRVGEAGAPVQDLTLAIDRRGRPTAAVDRAPRRRLPGAARHRRAGRRALAGPVGRRHDTGAGAALPLAQPRPRGAGGVGGRRARHGLADGGRRLRAPGRDVRPRQLVARRDPGAVRGGPRRLERPPAGWHARPAGRRAAGGRPALGLPGRRRHRRRAGRGRERRRGRGHRLGHRAGRRRAVASRPA